MFFRLRLLTGTNHMPKFSSQIINKLTGQKKIRRKAWGKYCWIKLVYNIQKREYELINQNNNLYNLSLAAIFADDWEEYKDV